jgi:hypothetical protein
VSEEISSRRIEQTKTERGATQEDKKNMLRHLVQVNKKRNGDAVLGVI